MSAPTGVSQQQAPVDGTVSGLFRCVACGQESLEQEQADRLRCPGCGAGYRQRAGIWDFKDYETGPGLLPSNPIGPQ